MDTATIIGVIILLASLFSTRTGRRGRTWRSAYMVVFLSFVHLAFLYQFFGPSIGAIGSEEWAAITAAGIAGTAADDDADAVGLLLVIFGVFQILLLSDLINLP